MQKYGLLGYPLGHSFSKTYFNQKFEAEKIDAEFPQQIQEKSIGVDGDLSLILPEILAKINKDSKL